MTRTRDEWFELLRNKDICVAPVNSLPEILLNPQILHRGMVVEVDHPELGRIEQIGVGIKLSRTPGRISHTAPLDGQNTREILEEIGYTRSQIEELYEEGVIA